MDYPAITQIDSRCVFAPRHLAVWQRVARFHDDISCASRNCANCAPQAGDKLAGRRYGGMVIENMHHAAFGEGHDWPSECMALVESIGTHVDLELSFAACVAKLQAADGTTRCAGRRG